MFDLIRSQFKRLVPAVDFCSIRVVQDRQQQISVRHGVLQPFSTNIDRGVMITIVNQGGYGYAATSDISDAGLKAAFARAQEWAGRSAGRTVTDYSAIAMSSATGHYASPKSAKPPQLTQRDIIDILMRETQACQIHDNIIDSTAVLWTVATDTLYLNTAGADLMQQFSQIMPGFSVSANNGADTQSRSLSGEVGICKQGDLSIFTESGLIGCGARLAEDALRLLDAPNCPTGKMDLLLLPAQMMLQIHESIGHPLELDRILGDERNYAGTSFVNLDMFGSYQYGSELLNVSFDPTRSEQLASYGWDDDGTPAEKVLLIKDGILQRPLGGTISQARAGIAGVAAARASSWNRPPLDRMSNLNVEPGVTPLEEMIAGVEKGVLMDVNTSWSIDDSRNKFQFGCEYGRQIENGELKGFVKNPNYRGISATFWRSLKAVGDPASFVVTGTPFCGKAEPNQVIRVGHASPACLFDQVNVFGGQE